MSKPLRILIIEDSENDALLIERELRRSGLDFTYERVDTAETMTAALDREKWDITLSDHFMPHFSSTEALSLLRGRDPDTPFIIVSGVMGEDAAVEAMKAGANDYVKKDNLKRLPLAIKRALDEQEMRKQHKAAQEAVLASEERFRKLSTSAQDAIIMIEREGAISFWNAAAERIFGWSEKEAVGKLLHKLIAPDRYRPDALKGFERFKGTGQGPLIGETVEFYGMKKDGTEFPLELSLSAVTIKDTWNAIGIIRDISERKKAEDRLRKALDGTIQVLASAAEKRDPYTAGHQRRVAQLVCAIAKEMGLSPPERIDGIRMAGLIHDIGKIAVPSEILSMPRRLTKAEFDLIKTHPQAGYDILKGIEFPWPVADMVHQHQERVDGSGYPKGLKGDEIMLEARILAVADVVEAMASHRPYRPALGIDAALDEISKNRGIFYDAAAVDACVRLFGEKGFKFEKPQDAG